MDIKEKLVEQLREVASKTPPICRYDNPDEIEHFGKTITVYCKPFEQFQELMRDAADYIAHGVTVWECGHWVSYQSDEPYGCMDDKEWYKCSKCGKDAHGRCYEDEWYSAPILSAYCPHCGAKMMPQPPKGE